MSNLKEIVSQLIPNEFDSSIIFPSNGPLKDEKFKIDAVSLCIICNNSMLFIKRSENMPSYKGHVAFLGGHLNPGETFIEGSLREFEEETSISSDNLEHLGYLKISVAKNLKAILPVVFYLNMDTSEFLEKAKSKGEWVDIFWVDFDLFKNKNLWRIKEMEYMDAKLNVHYFDLMQKDRFSQVSSEETYLLWGATARMVASLLRILK